MEKRRPQKEICKQGLQMEIRLVRKDRIVRRVEAAGNSTSRICGHGGRRKRQPVNVVHGSKYAGSSRSSMFKPHQAVLLQDLKLYIHQEPDKGGETFLRKIIEGLREGRFIGKVYRWSCNQIGCKDPSAVYIKYGKEEAREKIMRLIEAAEEIDLDAPEEIPEAIQGAPVNLRQPEGWLYSEKGISHIDERNTHQHWSAERRSS